MDFRSKLYPIFLNPCYTCYESPFCPVFSPLNFLCLFVEYHGDRFQPGELVRMKKQCFFASLWENYKYLVSHLMDQDDVDLVLMLKEIQECDELQYPASTSNPPKGTGGGLAKNTNYYDKKNYDRRGCRNYMAHAMNIQDSPEDYESNSLLEDASEKENDDVQQDRLYHIGIMLTADEGEAFFGKCYKCGEPGHPWWECKTPLKPTLKLALIVENDRKAALAEKKWLNQTGGTRVKGGCVPKATPAAAQK